MFQFFKKKSYLCILCDKRRSLYSAEYRSGDFGICKMCCGALVRTKSGGSFEGKDQL